MFISYNPFEFQEDFKCLDIKNIPAGICVEENSRYTHKHVRSEDGKFLISCKGNKFICNTPALENFKASLSFGLRRVLDYSGAEFYFGYDPVFRKGYSISLEYDKSVFNISLKEITPFEKNIIDTIRLENYVMNEDSVMDLEVEGNKVSGDFDGTLFAFDLPDYIKGLIGFTFLGSIGEMEVKGIEITSDDHLERNEVIQETTAIIPLRNGGNMPYKLTYSINKLDGRTYLSYSFDGGAQYREEYPDYPRGTRQYCVEQDIISDPFIAIYEKGSEEAKINSLIYNGKFATTDPGLVWDKVLCPYFGVIKLPLKGALLLPETLADFNHLDISFGYGSMEAFGYCMQKEENVEFIFDISTATLIYEGTRRGKEYIKVTSHSDAIIDMVPETVYNYDEVISHLERNHFFKDNEEIVFKAEAITQKDAKYIKTTAALFDVYGDKIADFEKKNENTFAHKALPIGVFRAIFQTYYGSKELMKKEIVFEVCGGKDAVCPPLASGLPFLFSMPNEQRYLDRDAFDLYNPVPDCNMEHYYACSSIPSDIAVRKKTWETNKLFGRKWYVWHAGRRTITEKEFEDYKEEVLKNCDYCYYPLKYECIVMRHDLFKAHNYNAGIMGYLQDFLNENKEWRYLVDENATKLDNDTLHALLKVCGNEWFDYSNDRFIQDAIEDKKYFSTLNSDLKRACYGPFPIYSPPMCTHNSMRIMGYAPNKDLSTHIFNGFAQLEDYPYSCAYHTYRGAFFVTHTLLHIPDLCIYPEEYTSSIGGCVDGAVKDANPPLGKYDMPTYFNVTHSYEYVYNTAYLNKDGFNYWKKRGFMQRDFTEDFVDAFVKGWKNVIHHEPKKPLRSISYLSEIPENETTFIPRPYRFMRNRSEIGLAYIYETARFCGIPNGFAFDFEALETLTADMTDCIVLPSLKDAPSSAIRRIRDLYNAGVSLIAVSDVSGLEDIFGVKEICVQADICALETLNGKKETVFPDSAIFTFAPTDAETLLWALDSENNQYPAVLKKERAILITAAIDDLGHSSYQKDPISYAENISPIFRNAITDALENLYTPIVKADNCGVTVLEDVNGDTLLLCVDYSDFDLKDKIPERTYNISINLPDVKDIEVIYGSEPLILTNENTVNEIGVTLRNQECALIKLIRN